MAVPGPIFSRTSRGTNRLIQQGAKLVLSAQDILDELNLTSAPQQLEMRALLGGAGANPRRRRCWACSPASRSTSTRSAAGCDLPTTRRLGTLAMLELKGTVRRAGWHALRAGQVGVWVAGAC